MENSEIFKNVQKHISLNDFEKKQFLNSVIPRNAQKKTLILEQGRMCKKIFFVESGSLRAFNLNSDGKESTIMFAVQGWWITDMNCFINQSPAVLSIEALETSELMELDFCLLEELYQKIPKFERFFRILFQNAYIREQLRALQNISMTTAERYWQFISNYPAIVEKVTQKQIASYLGVTPEFLSSEKKKY
jgi:CRP-like cAMP-binding protein